MAYIDAITELEQRLFRFDPQAEKVYNLINDLKAFIPVETKTTDSNASMVKVIKLVFDKNAAATEQVLFALSYLNVASRAGEILSAIKQFDASFDKGLSTPFYKLKEGGQIKIYNPTITEDNPTGSNQQVFYGLKEWFIKDNVLKKEYMPSEWDLL